MEASRIWLASGVVVELCGVVAAAEGCLSVSCTDDATCASSADAMNDLGATDRHRPMPALNF